MAAFITDPEVASLLDGLEEQIQELETSVLYNLITILNDESLAIQTKEAIVIKVMSTNTLDPQDNPLFVSEREEYERMFTSEEDQVEVAESVVHICPRCKSKRVTDRSVQARSADEQTGSMLTCATCKNTWFVR